MYIPVRVHALHVVEVFTQEMQNREQLVQFVSLFDRKVPTGHGL